MRATLSNVSPLPRLHWGVLTVPAALAVGFPIEASFLTEDGRRFRAVRGSTKGCRTVYRVRAALQGSEDVHGVLEATAHAAAGGFIPHPSVLDNLTKTLPAVGVRVRDGLTTRDHWTPDQPGSIKLVETSPAHQRWHLSYSIDAIGMRVEWWADVLHEDPVAHVWGSIVWSHRADPRKVRTVEFFALRSGEYVALDFAKALGVQPSLQLADGGWLTILNSASVQLQDGAGITFSGRMLTTPEDGATSLEIDNLRAAEHGPILGVSHDWNGHFLANRSTADLSAVVHGNDTALWLDALEQPVGWTGRRLFGAGPSPRATGAQEDFGAVKGSRAVSFYDPRAIRLLQFAAQAEILRGGHHYEDDGTLLQAVNHPNWCTWDMQTHWHAGVSPDRLGKTTASGGSGTGWELYDDQHRTANNLAAYLALSDDPYAQRLVEHWATLDEAAYRVKFPSYGVDAARAQGRTAQALAQLASTVDNGTAGRLLRVLALRLAPITANRDLDDAAGPVKVLAWGEPDPRKNVRKPDGTLGPWVSLWEHALALIGLRIALNVAPAPALERTVHVIAETLARFGCFAAPNSTEWWTVDDMLWNGGNAPDGFGTPGHPSMVAGRDVSGTRSWVLAGLRVAHDVLGTNHPLASKLAAYLSDHRANRNGALELGQAEWWAAVPR